jgi:hypothetical protein
MLTKTAIATTVLAILVHASFVEAALARGPADTATGNNKSQLQSCVPQDAGALSPGSDFVAVPYTFGSTFDYRPARTEEAQTPAEVGRKISKRHSARSSVPHC